MTPEARQGYRLAMAEMAVELEEMFGCQCDGLCAACLPGKLYMQRTRDDELLREDAVAVLKDAEARVA